MRDNGGDVSVARGCHARIRSSMMTERDFREAATFSSAAAASNICTRAFRRGTLVFVAVAKVAPLEVPRELSPDRVLLKRDSSAVPSPDPDVLSGTVGTESTVSMSIGTGSGREPVVAVSSAVHALIRSETCADRGRSFAGGIGGRSRDPRDPWVSALYESSTAAVGGTGLDDMPDRPPTDPSPDGTTSPGLMSNGIDRGGNSASMRWSCSIFGVGGKERTGVPPRESDAGSSPAATQVSPYRCTGESWEPCGRTIKLLDQAAMLGEGGGIAMLAPGACLQASRTSL